MNETIELKSGQQGYIEYKSSNPFEFYHILNELDKAPEIDAQGWLIFTEKGNGPFPVIFCVESSPAILETNVTELIPESDSILLTTILLVILSSNYLEL